MENEVKRCSWVNLKSPVYVEYHDKEWGVPVYDDQKLYEMFLLETFQAGLSWITILKKRQEFEKAFDSFDVEKIAVYDETKIEELMENKGIIRNRRKITAAIKNAAIFIEIQKEFGSFSKYLWGFTEGKIILNTKDDFPVKTELSDAVSKDLIKRGMGFVGSVTIYSYLQAIGIVNDHSLDCFCRKTKNTHNEAVK
jgi:DNA-3-methyladenine glycosylase I